MAKVSAKMYSSSVERSFHLGSNLPTGNCLPPQFKGYLKSGVGSRGSGKAFLSGDSRLWLRLDSGKVGLPGDSKPA